MIDTAEGRIGFDEFMPMAEVFALKHALQDHDTRKGLEAFFTSQAEEAIRNCYSAMKQSPPDSSLATGQAAVAKHCEESFNRLEEFVRIQSQRA